MKSTSMRRWLLFGFAFFVCITTTAGSGRCCPFCPSGGQTLTMDVHQASMVLFGTLTNAKLDPNGDFGAGTTDLVIDAVVKDHEMLGGKKVLTIPRYVPPDPGNPVKYLIFCDVFKGKIDPYRGIALPPKTDIVKYLQGALAVKDRPVSDRLKFFFEYLDNSDPEINADAFREFGNADYKDYREMAAKLPADKVATWLEDPATPAFRWGLYASMLGHCGTDKHAEVLRTMIQDPQKRMTTGIDGVLAGYAMLKPKEGWANIRGILGDEKKEFMFRYAALRAVRFFWEWRQDIVSPKEIVDATSLLLDQGDIADLAIEDLRKWGRSEVIDKVLDLYTRKTHDVPIVRRSILRYALDFAASNPKAAAFVAARRQEDAEAVKDAEELLKLEKTTRPPASPATAASK
jgi:hypothetical protein